jgi:hypothetical protein
MKNRFVQVLLLCLLACGPVLFAQNGHTGRQEWLQEMAEEELKITAFIKERTKPGADNEAIKQAFLSAEKHDEVPESALPELAENYLRNHYRQEYMKLHPEALKIYNPGRVQADTAIAGKPTGGVGTNIFCDYGDFETATTSNLPTQGYTGYAGPTYNYYTGGLCSFIPTTNVAYSNVGFSSFDDFLVTDNIPDPHVPAISQTHNGSKHAIRINGDQRCQQFGINMLQKSFSSPTSGRARINFSYALVMQGPHDGVYASGNAFFVARILDYNGNEVGTRVCVPANASGTGFQSVDLPDCDNTPDYKFRTLWRDWGCDFLEFDIQAGKQYTIEFFVSSCQWNVHYAYAYVDDICADVFCCPEQAPAPKKLKCTTQPNGSQLSWDPVPGAAYYKVFITTYHPDCCPAPRPMGLSTERNSLVTNLTVPVSLVRCFSWSVVAVMPDSCQSAVSEQKCSCSPAPPAPVNLDCIPEPDGSKLTWSPVAGAAYYKIAITAYDPACCPAPRPLGISMERTTSATTYTIPRTMAHCFSWRVITVMPDSSQSQASESKCSCTPPPPPPTSFDCIPLPDGSKLSWAPVAGAAYYRLVMEINDPLCCPGPRPPGLSIERLLTATTYTMPNIPYHCFSWRVQVVMSDSSQSDFTAKKCSCSPVPSFTAQPSLDKDETTEDNLSVSAVPNPASDYIIFTVQDKRRQNSINGLTLYFYDGSGKEIARKEIAENGRLQLSVQSYPAGAYVYEIRSRSRVLYKGKVIVKAQ